MRDLLTEIQEGLENGSAESVKRVTELALHEGISASEILTKGLIPAMDKIGVAFKAGDIYIPDVLMASRAAHASLYVLKPLLSKHFDNHTKGRVLIGTVAGDLHDIGKNMITMVLEGFQYEVIDMGIDVPKEQIIKYLRAYQPDILALSALLTTTMGELGKAIQLIVEEGLRKQVKIIVGGGPVTETYAAFIGADAYAEDAYTAVDAIDTLLKRKEKQNETA